MKSYRPFWVLSGLYLFIVAFLPVLVIQVIEWIKEKGGKIDGFDLTNIPVFHFPDIWQNITYVTILSKIIVCIIVLMSVTNEFSYRTIRQNIIDGLSRKQYLLSKLYFSFFISLLATLLVFMVCIVLGLVYTPNLTFHYFMEGMEFIPAFWLDLFSTLLITLLIGFYVSRSGLSIALVLLMWPLEYIFTSLLPDSFSPIIPYFPLHSINKLIEVPFPRYMFQEIQDTVSMHWVLIVILYCLLFIYLLYRKMAKSDF